MNRRGEASGNLIFAVVALAIVAVGYFWWWKPSQEEAAEKARKEAIIRKQTAIHVVLAEDERIDKWIRSEVARGCNAMAVAEMAVAQMKKTSLSECPQDFRDAYLAHIAAWDSRINWVKESGSPAGLVRAFFDGMRFDGTMLREDDATKKRVRETYQAAERIALSHGVRKDVHPRLAATPKPSNPNESLRPVKK